MSGAFLGRVREAALSHTENVGYVKVSENGIGTLLLVLSDTDTTILVPYRRRVRYWYRYRNNSSSVLGGQLLC